MFWLHQITIGDRPFLCKLSEHGYYTVSLNGVQLAYGPVSELGLHRYQAIDDIWEDVGNWTYEERRALFQAIVKEVASKFIDLP